MQSFLRPGVPDISNAASATIRGIEFEMAAATWHGMQLSGTVSWLEASYDRLSRPSARRQTARRDGQSLNNAPQWSGSGSAVYDSRPAGRGRPPCGLTCRGRAACSSRRPTTPSRPSVRMGSPLARWLRAAEPSLGGGRLRANLGNQDYITGTANVPIPAFTGRPAIRAVGYAIHPAPLRS